MSLDTAVWWVPMFIMMPMLGTRWSFDAGMAIM